MLSYYYATDTVDYHYFLTLIGDGSIFSKERVDEKFKRSISHLVKLKKK